VILNNGEFAIFVQKGDCRIKIKKIKYDQTQPNMLHRQIRIFETSAKTVIFDAFFIRSDKFISLFTYQDGFTNILRVYPERFDARVKFNRILDFNFQMDGNKLLSIDERGNAVEWKVSENDNNIKKINKYRFSLLLLL